MYTLTRQRDGKLLSGVAVVVRLAKYILSSFQEFEDTKGKNRIRKSKTHRQHNAQKIAKHRATLKTEDEHRCSGKGDTSCYGIKRTNIFKLLCIINHFNFVTARFH